MTPNNDPQKPRPDRRRIDEIFKALPKLGSKEFIAHIKTTPASQLPAQVLVRAYRQLPPGSPEANATLARLLGNYEKEGYLRPLWQAARLRISNRDWFGIDDLVADAIEEIAVSLGGPRGKGADIAWVAFLNQRLEDAYRAKVGRRGERQEPEKAEFRYVEDGEHTDLFDTIGSDAVAYAPWHGKVEGNDLVWLEEFVARVLAQLPDTIRQVAQARFSPEPVPMEALCDRFGVDRFQIRRWVEIARTTLYAALKAQKERDIDISWLKAR